MGSRRASAFRASALTLSAIFVIVGGLAASCAEGDRIDGSYSGGDGGDDGSSQQGAGGKGGGSVFTGGPGGGGEHCDPEETCDGVDNNCDGQVDEGCACKNGMTQDCYSGMPANTAGVGACKSGVQTCDEKGQWGPCEGEVIPKAEECNGKDDDCDNEVDEDLGMQMCGVGACQSVVAACENGVKPACVPLQPTVEICDGLDNNCNQLVDESYMEKDKPCTTGNQGACSTGKYTCNAGKLTCVQDMMPKAEVCDGVDNDCNGIVDDAPGTGGACSTGLAGACSNGVIACVGGDIDCAPVVQPIAEMCDNMDNDCDGLIDEDIPPTGNCQTGQAGACAAGQFTCSNGMQVCTPSALGNPEQCNGVDDNCNGQIDEGNPGAGQACNVPGKQGPCVNGTTACSGGVPVCNQTVQPAPEICGNGVDEDCSGVADNGCAGGCAHNYCSTGGPLTSGCDPCVTIVCGFDSTCCSSSWDSICVFEADSFCGCP